MKKLALRNIFRDARITTIYEGTTGIQATDLTGRKLLRDNGTVAYSVIDTMDSVAQQIIELEISELNDIANALARGD